VTEYIQELIDLIRRIHAVEAIHIESVRIKEKMSAETVWEGVVEVFELVRHPTANRIYAWSHHTDDPQKPRRLITVLHLYPIRSARDAVRAAIFPEGEASEPAE
jgi:hypothetical protein